MSAAISTAKIVFDETVFPRKTWNPERVEDFADALRDGAEFPPIELVDDGTNRIIDGVHRWKAHIAAGIDEIEVFLTPVPEDLTLLLLAAERAAKQGQPLTRHERQQVTVQTVRDHPQVPAAVIGEALGVPSSTVSRWTSALVQERKRLHRLQAHVLRQAGWTQQRIGVELGTPQQTVTRFLQTEILGNDLDLIAAAVEALDDLGDDYETVAAAADELRDEVQEAADIAEAKARTLKRLQTWLDCSPFAEAVLVKDKWRDEILAQLCDSDRAIADRFMEICDDTWTH